ncbi:SMR family transporter [Methylococcus sp. ANG]|uniref:SMR family transporter n=1 Tax=Methylococcus sp. ANG TaxID=3231903 RepID=UPI003457BEFE
MPWIYLMIAIIGEVIGTSALKSTEGFTRFWPSATVIVGYAVAFYFLSLTVDKIPVGISYAIWSALGIVLVSLIAWILHGQALDRPAIAGMGLIIAGVLVCTLWSKSATHG